MLKQQFELSYIKAPRTWSFVIIQVPFSLIFNNENDLVHSTI